MLKRLQASYGDDLVKSYVAVRTFVQRNPTCAMVLNGQVVGNIGFNTINHSLKKVEIGYWLSSAYEGQGIVSKSVARLLKIAFCELGMTKAQIAAAEGNKPSRRVCERLGFQLEGIIRQAENINGLIVDHAVYGLQKADWPVA